MATEELPRGIRRRGRAYVADVWIKGRRVRRAFPTLAEAVRERDKLAETRNEPDPDFEALLDGRETPKRPRSGGPLIADLLDAYVDRTRKVSQEKWRTVKATTASASLVRRILGDLPARELHPKDVERFIGARRKQGVKTGTINRDLRILKASLRYAVFEEKTLAEIPCRIRSIPITRKIPKVITARKFPRLLQAASERIRPILATAALAGLRNAELRFLQWEDVDLDAGRIFVRGKPEHGFTPKTYTERSVPIGDDLRDELERWRRKSERTAPRDWVFVRNPKTGSRWPESALCKEIRKVWEAADLGDAERPGLHHLRRYFATRLFEAAVPPATICELGGWSSVDALFKSYAGTNDAAAVEAVSRLRIEAA